MVTALRQPIMGQLAVARKRESRPSPASFPPHPLPGALEVGKGRWLEGTALQTSWVALGFMLFLNSKAQYLFQCLLGLSPQAKAQERSKIMT